MKVNIDCDRQIVNRETGETRGGWFYFPVVERDITEAEKSARTKTYAECKAKVIADGHELRNGGWRFRMLMWNWNNHAIDGYPGWEIENPTAERYERHPFFVKLTHTRVEGDAVESHALAAAWDDVAEHDFYQRDFTDDGIPFVSGGGRYSSGWWFATKAERDRFIAWHASRS